MNQNINSFIEKRRHSTLNYNDRKYEDNYKGMSLYNGNDGYFYFNPAQKMQYNTVMYGFDALPKEAQKTLPVKVIQKIKERHFAAQHRLAQWKQSLVDEAADDFLYHWFPNSKLTQVMLSVPSGIPDKKTRYTFKELGITQKMIIEKLLEWRFLTPNFFQLR